MSIESEGFRDLFKTLGSLIHLEEEVFIQTILPYLVYYSIRFCEEDSSQSENSLGKNSQNIVDTLTHILDGPSRHKPIAFAVLDLLSICEIQDRRCVAVHVRQLGYKFTEPIFQIEVTKNADEDDNAIKFFEQLATNPVAKASFITVNKIRDITNNISKVTLSKAAENVREYKRAILYYEEYLREEKLKKYKQNCIGLSIPSHLKITDYDKYFAGEQIPHKQGKIMGFVEDQELGRLCYLYSKILPEDYEYLARGYTRGFSSIEDSVKNLSKSHSKNKKFKQVKPQTKDKNFDLVFGIIRDNEDYVEEIEDSSDDVLSQLLDKQRRSDLLRVADRIIQNVYRDDGMMEDESPSIFEEHFSDIGFKEIDTSCIFFEFQDSDSQNTFENIVLFIMALLDCTNLNDNS